VPFPRASGILLHPTSLPGPYGIGDLGPSAHRFLEFLTHAGQRIWQVLPLGPTGYGDSPYQCFSAFAGNPLLISLDALVADELLTESDIAPARDLPSRFVDYGCVIAHRQPLWRRALERFEARAPVSARDAFAAFCVDGSAWLDDYALFMAVKEAHNLVSWTKWERPIALRDAAAVSRWRDRHAREIRAHQFAQFLFFSQWRALRAAAHAAGISLMGDIPIFVAHDSADVWAKRHLFQLRDDGTPAVVAGVPPDYFSATGQLWGNPHYRWDVLAREGYGWWIARVRAALALVDMVRLDHFRGFEASWEVPGDATTAIKGRWVKGPGAALFEAMQREIGSLPFVAENLGVITPEVEALRERFDFPGMAILQFAFGTDPQGPEFRPHNYPRNRVAYTGTHDNDTTVGWWTSGTGHSTRSDADLVAEHELTCRYLGSDGREIHWDFIRAVLASVADTAIVPLQDVLGLGSEARMNQPATSSGNWRWRVDASALTDPLARRLGVLAETYDRVDRTYDRVDRAGRVDHVSSSS
jgi:4-alpha-glucanotransferase